MRIDYETLRAIRGIDTIRGKPYINHVGLLFLSVKAGIESLSADLIESDHETRRYVFRAVAAGARGTFTGHGDADPGNVKAAMAGATLRFAETRALNRAMRSYCGLGGSTAEELPECEAEGILDGDPAPPALTVDGWELAVNRIEKRVGEVAAFFLERGRGAPSDWTDEERAPRLEWLLSADGQRVLEHWRTNGH